MCGSRPRTTRGEARGGSKLSLVRSKVIGRAALWVAPPMFELNLKFYSKFRSFFSNWITSPYATDPSSYRFGLGLGNSCCVVRGEVPEIRRQSRSRTLAIRPRPDLGFSSGKEDEPAVNDREANSSMISIQYGPRRVHGVPKHWIYSGLKVCREVCA